MKEFGFLFYFIGIIRIRRGNGEFFSYRNLYTKASAERLVPVTIKWQTISEEKKAWVDF